MIEISSPMRKPTTETEANIITWRLSDGVTTPNSVRMMVATKKNNYELADILLKL